ncbi:MAG: C40 family peptidase [Clostridia bacterium]|nr:C40 family peptidase [Clostridia bacterium]
MHTFYQKSPIDNVVIARYNVDVKRIIVLFLSLIFSFSLCGCNQINSIDGVLPPDIVVDTETDGEETDAENRKKSYAVSKVDGLRVRSGASGSSAVIGYLDKNDVVEYVGIVGSYVQTVYKEKTAYVHLSYCKRLEFEVSCETVESAIDIGTSLLGHPYVWGSQRYHWGNGVLNKNFVRGEFDCSALVQYVYYKAAKIVLDVNTRTQIYNGTEVELSDLKRGDLMFFTNASRYNKTGVERIGHVGIYFGNNYILHTASDHAVIEPISSLRWSYYITARRVV